MRKYFQCLFLIFLISLPVSVFGGTCGHSGDGVGSTHCTGSGPWTADSATYEDVNHCCNTCALSGDEIFVPAGSKTWSTRLDITNAIILIGAGIGSTNITSGLGSGEWLLRVEAATPANDPMIEISGFTFNGNDTSHLVHLVNTDSTYNIHNIRIHHCRFEDADGGIYQEGDAFGLVDHCEFDTGDISLNLYGNENASWIKNPVSSHPLGGADFLFFEDNTFVVPNGHNLTGTGKGTRHVIRYNYIDNSAQVAGTLFDVHGNTANRGTIAYEIYENVTYRGGTEANPFVRFVNLRGGTGVIFNNEIEEKIGKSYMTIAEEDDEEDAQHNPNNLCIASGDPWSCCTGAGTGTCIGCQSPPVPGRDPVTGSYLWNNVNTKNDALIWDEEDDPCGSIVEDTDWWDDMTGNPGGPEPSSNFAHGTALPGTCSDDDCYGLENANGTLQQLYRCVGDNNWSLIYQPASYPHSLQGSIFKQRSGCGGGGASMGGSE